MTGRRMAKMPARRLADLPSSIRLPSNVRAYPPYGDVRNARLLIDARSPREAQKIRIEICRHANEQAKFLKEQRAWQREEDADIKRQQRAIEERQRRRRDEEISDWRNNYAPPPATPATPPSDIMDSDRATPKTPTSPDLFPPQWHTANTRMPGAFPTEEECNPPPINVFAVQRTSRKRNRDEFEEDLDENDEEQLTFRKKVCFSIYLTAIVTVGIPAAYPAVLTYPIATGTYNAVRDNARPTAERAWQATQNITRAFPGFVAQSAYLIGRQVNQAARIGAIRAQRNAATAARRAQRELVRQYRQRFPAPPLAESPWRRAVAREPFRPVVEAAPEAVEETIQVPTPVQGCAEDPAIVYRRLHPFSPTGLPSKGAPEIGRRAEIIRRGAYNRSQPYKNPRKSVGRRRELTSKYRLNWRESPPFQSEFVTFSEDPDWVAVGTEEFIRRCTKPGKLPIISDDEIGEQIAEAAGPDTPVHYTVQGVRPSKNNPAPEAPETAEAGPSEPPPSTPNVDDVDDPLSYRTLGIKTSKGDTCRLLFGTPWGRCYGRPALKTSKSEEKRARRKQREQQKRAAEKRQAQEAAKRRARAKAGRKPLQEVDMNVFKQLAPLKEVTSDDITPPDSPATQLNTELRDFIQDDSDSDISETLSPHWIPTRRSQKPLTFLVPSPEKTITPKPTQPPKPTAAQSTKDENAEESSQPAAAQSTPDENAITSTSRRVRFKDRSYYTSDTEISSTCHVSPGPMPNLEPPMASLKLDSPESEISSTFKGSPGPSPRFFESPAKAPADVATPKTPADAATPKAARFSTEKATRQTRAQKRLEAAVSSARKYTITSLSAAHEALVTEALRSGHGKLIATDLQRVVPKDGGSGTQAWLNDETINAYLELVVTFGKRNDTVDLETTPSFHAFNSFFYTNLASKKGYDSVARWGKRARIGGKKLLETKMVFIPVNSGMHWTLIVVDTRNKTIRYYDSLGGHGKDKMKVVLGWIEKELGTLFDKDEWKMERGDSGRQANSDDCGVFTITNARQVMLEGDTFGPGEVDVQRKRIVAELVAGRLLEGGA